jgi:hypothetical protein
LEGLQEMRLAIESGDIPSTTQLLSTPVSVDYSRLIRVPLDAMGLTLFVAIAPNGWRFFELPDETSNLWSASRKAIKAMTIDRKDFRRERSKCKIPEADGLFSIVGDTLGMQDLVQNHIRFVVPCSGFLTPISAGWHEAVENYFSSLIEQVGSGLCVASCGDDSADWQDWIKKDLYKAMCWTPPKPATEVIKVLELVSAMRNQGRLELTELRSPPWLSDRLFAQSCAKDEIEIWTRVASMRFDLTRKWSLPALYFSTRSIFERSNQIESPFSSEFEYSFFRGRDAYSKEMAEKLYGMARELEEKYPILATGRLVPAAESSEPRVEAYFASSITTPAREYASEAIDDDVESHQSYLSVKGFEDLTERDLLEHSAWIFGFDLQSERSFDEMDVCPLPDPHTLASGAQILVRCELRCANGLLLTGAVWVKDGEITELPSLVVDKNWVSFNERLYRRDRRILEDVSKNTPGDLFPIQWTLARKIGSEADLLSGKVSRPED